jgi:hypothetical protein
MTHRFIQEMEKIMIDQVGSNSKIYHFTSTDSAKKSNSAILICAYAVFLYLNYLR